MTDAIERARKQFQSETTEHRMTVLHDDGVYRHLRFAKPGTWLWGFDIVTWPGHLAISGDVGDGWSFARLHDMLEFFDTRGGEHGINADYWWQKMPSHHRDAARTFSAAVLKEHAQSTIAEWDLLPADKARAQGEFNRAWASVDYEAEHEYREVIDRFEFTPASTTSNISGRPMRFYDTWEWESKDYDHHFLLALYAIVFAVRKYREYEAAIEAARDPLAA